MDKIWYRNPSKSEVIGRCGGDEKNRMTTQNRQKSNAKKKNFKHHTCTHLLDLSIEVILVTLTARQSTLTARQSHQSLLCFRVVLFIKMHLIRKIKNQSGENVLRKRVFMCIWYQK